MRYIDELIALYPGKDPATRKYLLAQMLDLPADAYSSEISEFLWTETRSPDAVVRRQARHTMGQFLPVHTSFSFRFEVASATNQQQIESLGGLLVHAGPEGRRLAQGAAAALDHLLPRLTELMGVGSSTQRVATSLVLGRVHKPAVVKSLARAVLAAEPSWQAAFSLSETGEEFAVHALVRAIGRHGHTRPDLFMLLRALPSDASLALLAAAEPRTDATGRANIALALGQYPSSECRELLEQLIKRREGWVTAYALDTLAGFGDPDDMPLIRLAYELETHDFVRAQALRAAGNIRSPEAREFLEAALPDCKGRNLAAALDALGRQQMAPEELAQLARPHLESDNVNSAVRAVLLVGASDPDAALEPLSKLVAAQAAATRRLGAFALGELQLAQGIELLDRMVTTDPSGSVRLEAIRSLARHPTPAVLPILIRLLEHPAPRLFMTAGRALGAIRDRPGLVVEALSSAFSHLPPASRGAALRAMGRAARPTTHGVPAPLVEALTQGDPVLVTAALEGIKHLGDRIPVEVVLPLLAHSEARVRARATLTMFLSGRAPHCEALGPMLGSNDETVVMEALGALMEIGLIVPYVSQGGFQKLAQDLRERARVAQEGGVPAPELSEAAMDAVALRALASESIVDAAAEAEVLARSARMGPKQRKGDAPNLHASQMGNVSPVQTTRNLAEVVAQFKRPDADLEGGASEEMAYERLRAAAASAPIGIPVHGQRAGSGRAGIAGSAKVQPPPPSDETPSMIIREKRRTFAPLIAASLILGLAVAAVVARTDSGPPPETPASTASGAPLAPSKTTPRVWSLVGTCGRLDAEGGVTPLEISGTVAPGRVGTRSGANMELGFPDGSAIALSENSELTLGGPPPVRSASSSAPVVFADPSGKLVVQVKAMELQIKLGGAGYRTTSGKVRVTGTPQEWTLEQLEGDGMLVRADRSLDTLVAGQTRTLERAGATPR